jgi:UDP-N-acetylglucosamine 2-epimerase (hydrolysing)
LLKHADAILGNSSAGIREAPVYGTPTINLGRRQSRRSHHESIFNLDFDRSEVARSLVQLEHQERFAPALNFGEGHSSEEFMASLRGTDLWEVDRQKQFMDLRKEEVNPVVGGLR